MPQGFIGAITLRRRLGRGAVVHYTQQLCYEAMTTVRTTMDLDRAPCSYIRLQMEHRVADLLLNAPECQTPAEETELALAIRCLFAVSPLRFFRLDLCQSAGPDGGTRIDEVVCTRLQSTKLHPAYIEFSRLPTVTILAPRLVAEEVKQRQRWRFAA